MKSFWKKPIQGYDPFAGADKEFYFDEKTAENVCSFIGENFKHSKGQFAGKNFILIEWERRFVGHLFGWKRRSDNSRRYRTTLLYIPKKNGKSFLGSCIGLILLCADNEMGAEIYSTAGDIEQAKIVFNMAAKIVEQNKVLKRNIRIYYGYNAMKYEATQSYWKVLSSESRTKHGPNIHGLIVDELHVQKDRKLTETLTAGVAIRRQPLVVYMTTADYARQSPCNEEYDYAKKVRDGIIVDKEYLPCIYEADQSDDWKAESTWKKANPSYGITLPKSFFKAAIKKAIERPSYENTFKRLHLNMQTKTETRWIDLTAWNDSGDKVLKPESLLGKPCYAGLDLSSSNDITAFVLYFPEPKACLPFFFVPKRTAENRAEFIVWDKAGLINITEGNVSHSDIRSFILEKNKQYKILDTAYDSWNATQLAMQLADHDGLPMIEFRQGFFSMNEPSKMFETLVLNKELTHFDNPVLAWMVSNTNVKEDSSGNIKPIKPEKTSRLKIDGVVALVMAIGLSIGKEAKKHEDKNSVYNQRGMITL